MVADVPTSGTVNVGSAEKEIGRAATMSGEVPLRGATVPVSATLVEGTQNDSAPVPQKQITSDDVQRAHQRVMEALEEFGELAMLMEVPTTATMMEFRKSAKIIDETEVSLGLCAAMWRTHMKQLNSALIDKLNQELDESKK